MLMKSFEQRRNFTRFRISSHRLQIERGRYQGAPRQNRPCLRCTSSDVDDEKHFLFSCTTAPLERASVQDLINKTCPNFASLNQDQKLFWLLNNENVEILISISNLIIKGKSNLLNVIVQLLYIWYGVTCNLDCICEFVINQSRTCLMHRPLVRFVLKLHKYHECPFVANRLIILFLLQFLKLSERVCAQS